MHLDSGVMRVLPVILLVLHFRWCVAETHCAQAPGSCGKQQSSLMQLKAFGVRKAQIQHDSVASTTSRLAIYQKFAEQMIAMDAAGRLEISQDVLNAVTLIHEFIAGLYNILKGSDIIDRSDAERCLNISKECQEKEIENGTLDGTGDVVVGNNVTHRNCRDQRETECDGADGACETYDTYRQDDSGGRDEQFLPDCANSRFGSGFLDADQSTPQGQINLGLMETCLGDMFEWLYGGVDDIRDDADDNSANNDDDALWPKFAACRRNNCEDLATQCAGKQTTYEQSVCVWATKKAAHCDAYYHCVVCHEEDCTTTCQTIEKNWQGREADNETAQRLTCLLDVLFGAQDPDNTSGTGYFDRSADDERPTLLSNCKNQEYDTSEWEVPCSIHTDDFDCGVPKSPCDTQFLQTHYYDPTNSFTEFSGTATNIEAGRDRRINQCAQCNPIVPAPNENPSCAL